jgi:hypothetical protein
MELHAGVSATGSTAEPSQMSSQRPIDDTSDDPEVSAVTAFAEYSKKLRQEINVVLRRRFDQVDEEDLDRHLVAVFGALMYESARNFCIVNQSRQLFLKMAMEAYDRAQEEFANFKIDDWELDDANQE